MYNPLISVVIPVWNRPAFLMESAISVLNQTYENFELIIVDDGSTDETLLTANKLATNKRVRVITKEHSGTSDTFNRGVEEVKGDYFCLLGSDDLWHPEKLQRQVEVSEMFPEHVIHTESLRIDGDGNPQKDVYRSTLKDELGDCTPKAFYDRHASKPYAAFFGSSIFVPVKALEVAGPFPDTMCQDYHWVIIACLIHHIRFTLIPEHLIQNRTNPRSTTSENYKFILKESIEVWESVKAEAGI